MGRYRIGVPIVLTLLVFATGVVSPSPAGAAAPAGYDHMFVIVEENHSFTDVIPNPAAPNLDTLAQQYGLATDYFGVSHPSEPNYVALLGGSTFNVTSDNPYWTQTVDAPNLISQLDRAGVSWKAYLDGVPHAGYKGICYPIKCNGTPDIDPLFVSKHDAIQNFTTSRSDADWARQVPIGQLAIDLAAGTVPRFGYVIPSECLDMHGDPPYCVDGGNPFDAQDQHLVSQGDEYLGQLVATITGAKFWSHGNNAIAIVFDEGDDNGGFGNVAGGQVASIVVTSHGPRGMQDATPYSHYSLLRTLQDNFAVGCLQNSCGATPMSPLFAVTGSPARAFTALAQATWPTPTPAPVERERKTLLTPSQGGWDVVKSPLLGTNDNSLGAVAASSPSDVWAVGNFVPDTSTSNQDATLTLANHFDGHQWSVVPTPNSGPNYNTLFGVAASNGLAWAVGVAMSSDFRARALIESWDGTRWSIVDAPQPGSQRDILFGASATSTSDVWAVGDAQGADGRFTTLVEHFDGRSWALSGSQNPGDAGDSFYGVDAIAPNDVWAVGQQLSSSGVDSALIEHWNGSGWTVMSTPATGGFAAALYGVSGSDDGLVAVGETDSLAGGSQPLIERLVDGAWHVATLPALNGPQFGALWAVASSGGTVWAVGSNLDAASGDMHPAVYTSAGGGAFNFVQTPNLQAGGDTVLGGVTLAGDTWWAVGLYGSNAHLTLIENHQQA